MMIIVFVNKVHILINNNKYYIFFYNIWFDNLLYYILFIILADLIYINKIVKLFLKILILLNNN